MMICAEQIKAARAWMGWTRDYLAEEAGVSSGTIRNLEDGNISPRDDTTRAICEAFERKGLEFTPDGIRKRRREFLLCDGQDKHLVLYTSLMNSVVSGEGGGVMAVTQNQSEFFDLFCNNQEWLRRINEFASIRCLMTDENRVDASPYTRIAFKAAVTEQDKRLPGCLIFDRKFVMIRKIGRGYQFMMIGDAEMAHYHKALFDAAWKKTDAA